MFENILLTCLIVSNKHHSLKVIQKVPLEQFLKINKLGKSMMNCLQALPRIWKSLYQKRRHPILYVKKMSKKIDARRSIIFSDKKSNYDSVMDDSINDYTKLNNKELVSKQPDTLTSFQYVEDSLNPDAKKVSPSGSYKTKCSDVAEHKTKHSNWHGRTLKDLHRSSRERKIVQIATKRRKHSMLQLNLPLMMKKEK